MVKKLNLRPGNALVIIAHPDDETIWMGGTILKFPQIRWTVFSLCRGNDPDRAPKFRKACAYYGARGIITDLEDESKMNIKTSVPLIEKYLRLKLKRKNFTPLDHESSSLQTEDEKRIFPKFNKSLTLQGGDLTGFTYLFTHGYNGEYSHPRHKGVHRAVVNLVRRGILKTKLFFTFHYQLNERLGLAVNDKEADFEFKLPEKIFRQKQKIIHDLYGFKKNTFECQSAGRLETFKMRRFL